MVTLQRTSLSLKVSFLTILSQAASEFPFLVETIYHLLDSSLKAYFPIKIFSSKQKGGENIPAEDNHFQLLFFTIYL